MDNAQYFYRKVVFTRKNNQISLADINQPDNISPLEDWMGTVISLVDGIQTIHELIDYLKQKYEVAPVNLEETLHSVVERLLEGELIQLSDIKVDLPYYLALPIEQLDIEKAKQLMAEEEHNSTSGES